MKIQPLPFVLTLSLIATACGDKEEDTATPVDTNIEDTGEDIDTADTEDTSDTEDPATDIVSMTFDDASSTAEWTAVADATRSEAVME